MNKSSSVLINRRANRTIFANIVEQKKAVADGKQLRVTYVTDNTNSVLVSAEDGAVETTVAEYTRYIDETVSEISNPVQSPTPSPSAPTPAPEGVEGPTITLVYAKDKGLIMNFTLPSFPSGYTVSNYDYSTDGGATYRTLSPADNSSPILIPGLTPLTAYNVKLKARFTNSQISAPSNTYSVSTKKYQIIDTIIASGTWTAPADISWCQYLVVGAGGGGGASYSDIEVLGNVPFVASNPGGASTYWINSAAGTFYGYMYKGSFSRYSSTKPVRMTVVDSDGNPITSPITPGSTTYIYNKWHPGEIVYWSISSGMPNVSNYFSPYTIDSTRSNNISSGGGGGAGGRVRYTIGTNIQQITPSATYNVVVGAGGAGGIGSEGAEGDGQPGGTSSFDTIDCSGGSGGCRSKDGNTNPQNGYGKGGTGGFESSNFFSGQGGSGLLTPTTNSNYNKYNSADPGGQAWYVDFDEDGSSELYATGGAGGIPNTVSAVTAIPYSGIGGSGTGSTLNSFASGRAGAAGVVKIKYYTDRDPTVPDTEVSPIPSGNVYTSPTTNVGVDISSASPFTGGGYAYEFNGTSEYLTVSGDNSWAFGSGAFTIEWFQYQTDNNDFPRIFATATDSIGCSIESGTLYPWLNGEYPISVDVNDITPDDYKNKWIHFAIVRDSSGILNVYKDGNSLGSGSDTTNITNNISTLFIGVQKFPTQYNTWFGGYLTNIRIVKGLAVYTGNFTVPTSALTLTASANPYMGSNTAAIPAGYTKLLLVPTI